MRFIGLLLIATGAFAAPATALRCGNLLDVKSGQLRPDVVVLVVDGKVSQAGPASSVTVPAGTLTVDLTRGTCLPGLIDAHDHLTSDPSDSGYKHLGVSVPRSTITGVKNARITLRAGFTTVRNVGADGYSDVALRDAIQAGDVEGPRLLVSGPALGITGGHCDENLLAPECHFASTGVADGPWPARAKVRENVK